MELSEARAIYRLPTRTGDSYRHTDVGPLPMDWQIGHLRDLATIRTGIAKNSGANIDHPVLVNYLRVANVQDGYLDLSEMSQLKIRAEDVRRYAVLPGDMLMNEGGDLDKLGRGALWKGEVEPCVHQNHVFVVRCGSQLLPEFLSAWTGSASARRFFKLAGRQTTNLASINKTSLGQFPVPLPPTKDEQQAVAEALSDADTLIESLSLLLAKKRQIKQGAMQELLTGKKRLPGFRDKWAMHRLGHVAEIDPENLPANTKSDFSFNYIALEDVERGVLKSYSEQTFYFAPSRARRKLRQGDVLVATVRPNLQSHLLFEREQGAWVCSTGYAVVRCGERLHPRYLFEHLFGATINRQIESLLTGSNYPAINNRDVRGLEIPLPSFAEQTAIANMLAAMSEEIAFLGRKLAKVRLFKEGMMQELLTGRIRLIRLGSNVIPLPIKAAAPNRLPSQSAHSWQINEAVVIGVLAQRFGNEKFPLPRKRRVKLMYLLHRHAEGRAEGYLKKAAGPYDPNTKYKGPEAIALKNGYVRALRNDTYEGFVAGDKIDQAQRYFEQWYGTAALDWLERFHYRKTDDLELLATVDMAMVDLAAVGQPVDVAGVKRVIAGHPEWVPKLSRELFSDNRITGAISECQALFSG